MDDKVIAKVKRISKRRHQSISKMMEEHIKALPENHIKKNKEIEIPEWIQQLGVKRWKNVSTKNDPKLEYLLKKHVKR